MKNIKKIILIASLAFSVLIYTGCGASKTVKGGAIGAVAGGAIGALIGNAEGNTTAGVIIGSAVGGTAGALIGNYMDKQAEELDEELQNADVERVGEGIKITFDSGILFAVDSYVLDDASKADIKDLADVLQKYEDTNVLVTGHTDSTGPTAHNEELSLNRANSVANYLKTLGVSGSRLTTVGLGETEPVASNDTEAGRQQNRRVEIAIFANEDLKEAAENGELSAQ